MTIACGGADTNGTPATQEVTFEYDALGRRVARSEAGNNVFYVHAGQQVIADYARGAATAAPSFRYVYGSYVDEPLLRRGKGVKGEEKVSGTEKLILPKRFLTPFLRSDGTPRAPMAMLQ